MLLLPLPPEQKEKVPAEDQAPLATQQQKTQQNFSVHQLQKIKLYLQYPAHNGQRGKFNLQEDCGKWMILWGGHRSDFW